MTAQHQNTIRGGGVKECLLLAVIGAALESSGTYTDTENQFTSLIKPQQCIQNRN